MNLHELKKKKTSVIDFINSKFKDNQIKMIDLYRSWLLNIAWIRGYQNVDYDIARRSFVRNQKDPWRPRLISNLMLPLVRKLIANLTYIHPVWDVIPATSDETDIQIANTSTKICRYIWENSDMSLKLVRLLYWQASCGNAFFKVGWDATLGDEIEISSKYLEQQLLNQILEMQGIGQVPEKIKINEGELFIDPVSPFKVIFDDVDVIQDSDFVIESNIRSKDWVVEKFGNKFKDLNETDEHVMLIFPSLYSNNKIQNIKKGVLVQELFVRKNNILFPKGLHTVIGGGEILIAPQDNPFEHGQLPYAHFLEIYDPSCMWGTCIAEQIRPNQAEYNRIRSGIVEQVQLMGQVQWLNPKQSEVSEFTNKPGQSINYRAPYAPQQLQPKALPAYVERALDRIKADIQDVASSHDVSEGKNEPGVRSGKGILALQDADNSVLGPVLLWFDDRLSYTGRLALQTFVQYADEGKVLNIVGEYNQLETVTFNNEMMKGKNKGNYYNVRVKTYGRQHLSRSGREELVKNLIELQIFNPVTDRDKILRILGAADILSVYDASAADYARQYREIQKLIDGEQILVTVGEHHGNHKDAIKKFIGGGEWDSLKPEQRQAVVKHYEDHAKKEIDEVIFPKVYVQSLGLVGEENARTSS